jgi:hypothetical protein
VRRVLDEVVEWLVRLGRHRLIERLQPGMPPELVARLLTDSKLAPTVRLVELYSWRNGTIVDEGNALDDLHFFPGFYFLSLEEALDKAPIFRDDSRWRDGWLPLFANGGGDFYVADLCGEPTLDAPIIGFLLGEPEAIIEYEGLESMMQTLRRCYASGVFWVDDRDCLEMDDERHAEIARAENPALEFWRE